MNRNTSLKKQDVNTPQRPPPNQWTYLEVVVLIDVDGEDRAEDLLAHGDGARIGRLDHGGLHEVTLAVIRTATDQDLAALHLRLLDVAGAVEGTTEVQGRL